MRAHQQANNILNTFTGSCVREEHTSYVFADAMISSPTELPLQGAAPCGPPMPNIIVASHL